MAKRILLVDDEELNRLIIRKVLKAAGYECHGCGSGEEALTYIRENRCDVVLMDRQMPGMDGIETARRIRSLPDIVQPKIISFSAYSDEADRKEAIEAGMDGVIDKPVTLDQLRDVLQDPQDS